MLSSQRPTIVGWSVQFSRIVLDKRGDSVVPFKVRSLFVRPWKSADLAFEVGGVLSIQNPKWAELGSKVPAFDLPGYMANLKGTVDGNPGKIRNDAATIRQQLTSQALFAIRNSTQEAALEQVVAQREVTWLEKYKHKAQIVAALKEVYPNPAKPNGKVQRLARLSEEFLQYKEALKAAYEAQKGWDPNIPKNVVKDLTTESNHGGTTDALTKLTPVAMKTSDTSINVTGAAPSNHAVGGPQVVPQKWSGAAWVEMREGDIAFKSQTTTTDHKLSQSTITRFHEFRHPYLENLITENRAQLDLQDELLLHKNIALSITEQDTIMDRELQIVDLEIARFQNVYVQTFLLSPISGVVTAVYKDVGEWVQPGEPVVRVEDDKRVLLVGVLQYRGPLRLGRTLKIKTTNVFDSPDPIVISAKIVSIRGHDSNDDEWDVILSCENDGDPPLPLNYHFDKDITTFEFA